MGTQAAGLTRRAEQLLETETARAIGRTRASIAARDEARRVMPLGLPANGQLFGPSALVAKRAHGSHLEDLDGNLYTDFAMGYGALFAGHAHPAIVAAVTRQLSEGTLFVVPCEDNTTVATALSQRFGQPQWRFTNSGTETTMTAVRTARAFTGRDRVVKAEGGYHGHNDTMMASFKPPLDQAGPASAPNTVGMSTGVPAAYLALTSVVAFNDLEALERALGQGDVACVILEPALQNVSMVLPEPGYLEGVRRLCDDTGTLLVYDEVKIGITAGWGGASTLFGVRPDLVCVSKSIGGGLPMGAFGGRADVMEHVRPDGVTNVGTFSGNPLSMAAARAVLEVCTPAATEAAVALATRFSDACRQVLDDHDLPAHTVQLGAKGCVTWAPQPLRTYRDSLSVNMTVARAQWLWCLNRDMLFPAAADSQWLVSLQHTEADIDGAVDVFSAFADAITA